MFCSTIIPTIGRAAVDRAVESVLQQVIHAIVADTHVPFEVIVVNDSGQPLPDAEWNKDPRVRIVETNRRERSVARNTGAALARGEYLHFLDDDDWLLPGAFGAFVSAAKATPTLSKPPAWLYGHTQLVDRQEQPLLQLSHRINGNGFVQTMAGEWIPLQSSLISSQAFFAVGGFEPLISGPEDIDLLRRIALHGELLEVDALVSCLGMGAEGSSTDTEGHAERSRWAREKILSQPSAFKRMVNSIYTVSTDDVSQWRGRWVRIYLTSIIWNVKNLRLFTALSRACHTVAALAMSVGSWPKANFWKSMASKYESQTFAQGARQADARQQSCASEPMYRPTDQLTN